MRVPDQSCLFSPGPPILQASKAFLLVYKCVVLGFVAVSLATNVLMAKTEGPVLKLAIALVGLVIIATMLSWVLKSRGQIAAAYKVKKEK
ncbi:hypothetical protein V8C37DRAFT_386090 [Trichoderma ceciliae]